MTQSIFKNDIYAGKTVLVTGGGTGIGFAIAQLLGELGAHVIIAARTLDVLEEAKKNLHDKKITCDIYELNIRDTDSVNALFETLINKNQLPDILINNAGGQFEAKAVDISANGFRSVIDLNLNGTWLMSSAYGKACMLPT